MKSKPDRSDPTTGNIDYQDFTQTLTREKKARASASFGSSSNSQDNDSDKDKNGVFDNDVNMAEEEVKEDFPMQEDSYVYNNETAKKSNQEPTPKAYSGQSKENRRSSRARKMKESKQKPKMPKSRKNRKRNHEEYSQLDYRNERDSISELTRYRSEKLAREREEIVEARTLAPKVLQF